MMRHERGRVNLHVDEALAAARKEKFDGKAMDKHIADFEVQTRCLVEVVDLLREKVSTGAADKLEELLELVRSKVQLLKSLRPAI